MIGEEFERWAVAMTNFMILRKVTKIQAE